MPLYPIVRTALEITQQIQRATEEYQAATQPSDIAYAHGLLHFATWLSDPDADPPFPD